MNNFDFYDANMLVRLKTKNGRIGKQDIVYGLYVYPSRDSSLSYAITAFESESLFCVRCVENYDDATALFSLISDNGVDALTLADVADDYYSGKKVYNM